MANDDPITALLDAAANPRGQSVYTISEWERRIISAVFNGGIRAFAEEWLRYGRHDGDCAWHDLGSDGSKCTCGFTARRQQIEAYLKATKP